MSQPQQPQFTSTSLAQAWETTVKAVHDLLTGEYPRGLAAAERTFLLERALHHLKTFTEPLLGEMLVKELAAAAPAPEPAKAECKDCPPHSAGSGQGKEPPSAA